MVDAEMRILELQKENEILATERNNLEILNQQLQMKVTQLKEDAEKDK